MDRCNGNLDFFGPSAKEMTNLKLDEKIYRVFQVLLIFFVPKSVQMSIIK